MYAVCYLLHDVFKLAQGYSDSASKSNEVVCKRIMHVGMCNENNDDDVTHYGLHQCWFCVYKMCAILSSVKLLHDHNNHSQDNFDQRTN